MIDILSIGSARSTTSEKGLPVLGLYKLAKYQYDGLSGLLYVSVVLLVSVPESDMSL